MDETTFIVGLLKDLGPVGIILAFTIWLLVRDKRIEKNGNGTDKTTVQALAATQKTMAHTIELIEENGSVPFQVHVARSEEKYKNLAGDVLIQGKRLDDQSGRLDVYEDGQDIAVHILKDIIRAHNRIHPEATLTGPD